VPDHPLVAERGTDRLCTIVQAAEGRTEPCTEDRCAYWEKGCILAAADSDLLTHPDVAQLLLDLRRRLERARIEDAEGEVGTFHRRLAAGRE
jgi:hypothetical protein